MSSTSLQGQTIILKLALGKPLGQPHVKYMKVTGIGITRVDVCFFRAQEAKKRTHRPSRERPKSAPYLKLKNSKRTSECQVLSSTVPA